MWDKMHTEKTNMLWSKEEYFNSMHTHKTLERKLQTFQEEQKNADGAKEESKNDSNDLSKKMEGEGSGELGDDLVRSKSLGEELEAKVHRLDDPDLSQ